MNRIMNKTGKGISLAVIMIVALAVLAVGGIAVWRSGIINKIFQPVPSLAPDYTAGWKIYRDASGAQFKYPEKFGANVWHPQFWPPKLSVFAAATDPFKNGCPELPPDSVSDNVAIGGIGYSRMTGQDAGAGSLYSTYCYVAQKGQKNYVLYFVIWSHLGCGGGNCGAYCGTDYDAECRALDRPEQIEKPIERIVATFSF